MLHRWLRALLRFSKNPYLWIFTVALLLRLGLMQSYVSNYGEERLPTFSPDMREYWASAQRVFQEVRFDDRTILVFGPGYPSAVALMGAVVGMDPYRILVFQAVLAALTSVILARFVAELTGRRGVGLIAGALHATSLIAVVLGAIMWSEAVFFFLFVFSAWLLLRGLSTGSYWYFVWSGCTLALAVLTRSAGLFLPMVYIAFGLWYTWPVSRARWRDMRRPLVGVLIAVLVPFIVCGAWVIHNTEVHGVSQLAMANPTGFSRISRLAMSRFDTITMQEADSLFVETLVHHPLYDHNRDQAFIDASLAAFRRQFSERPWRFVGLLVRNAWDNMTTESGPGHCPDKPHAVYKSARSLSAIPGVRYRGILLMGVGAVVLWRSRQYRLLFVLSLFVVYFAAAGVFAVGQGSRIFFPAQITGQALVAIGLVRGYEWFTIWRHRLARRPTGPT